MTTTEMLEQCTIDAEEGILHLPHTTLDRKDYTELKKQLEMIGGKWNRYKDGFVFQSDPTALVELLKSGEPVDLKKKFQFYGTPYKVAELLTDYLSRIITSDKVLEPSAGQGALIQAVRRENPNVTVDCFELMDINRLVLRHVEGANLIGDDFMAAEPQPIYDKIIMNPPFSRNQDIDHVRRAYEWLKDDGELVAIMSMHWTFANDKKSVEFREWAERVECLEMQRLERGEFAESGTNIAAVIVRICK